MEKTGNFFNNLLTEFCRWSRRLFQGRTNFVAQPLEALGPAYFPDVSQYTSVSEIVDVYTICKPSVKVWYHPVNWLVSHVRPETIKILIWSTTCGSGIRLVPLLYGFSNVLANEFRYLLCCQFAQIVHTPPKMLEYHVKLTSEVSCLMFCMPDVDCF